jgi:hypothetical protein
VVNVTECHSYYTFCTWSVPDWGAVSLPEPFFITSGFIPEKRKLNNSITSGVLKKWEPEDDDLFAQPYFEPE